jgi:hypothetical protein
MAIGFRLLGTVTENGEPVQRTVRLYGRFDGALIAEEESDSNGAFEFSSETNAPGITDYEEYYLVALDDVNVFPDLNALIYDRMVPEEFEIIAVGHRYWRFSEFVSGDGPQIGEIEVSDSGGTVQTQATASAAGDIGISNGPVSRINDGTIDTDIFWNDTNLGGNGRLIDYDFGDGNEKNLISLRLGLKFNPGTSWFPTGLKVYWSDNGSAWTLQATLTGISYPGANAYTTSFDLT